MKRLDRRLLAGIVLATTIAVTSLSLQSQVIQAQPQTQAPSAPIKLDAPYVPTPESVVTGMLKLANVTSDDVVYDLGSGDGRLVITAVQKFGAKRGVGVEINPGLVNRSNENARQAGVSDRAQFIQQDLFKTDFRAASVVTLYLLPKINLELRPKLLSELKPGVRVVSHAFDMGDWKPDRTIIVQDGNRPRIAYLWIIPANVAGTWRGSFTTKSGQQSYRMQISQVFQTLRVTMNLGGQVISIPQVSLRGDRIRAEHNQKLNGQDATIRVEGRVEGDRLQGTAEVKTKAATEVYRLSAQRQ